MFLLGAELALYLQGFRHVARVPKTYLLRTHQGQPQIIRPFGPGQTKNRVFAAILVQDDALALEVVDGKSVVVLHVAAGHVSATAGEANGRDASRIFLQLKSIDFFGSESVPNVHAGPLARLGSNDLRSVLAHREAKDVIPVV